MRSSGQANIYRLEKKGDRASLTQSKCKNIHISAYQKTYPFLFTPYKKRGVKITSSALTGEVWRPAAAAVLMNFSWLRMLVLLPDRAGLSICCPFPVLMPSSATIHIQYSGESGSGILSEQESKKYFNGNYHYY